jgi:glycosyltransferase involved in cell wall biosynthesis
MAPIRLLHLLNTLDDASLNRLVLNLVRGLDQERYELYVGCLFGGGPLADELRRAGASVVNFEMQGYRDLGVISRVYRYIRCHDVQGVHTHILRADLVGWLASRLAGSHYLFATKHNLGYTAGQEKRAIRNLLYYASLYMPDVVIIVSDWLRQRLARLPGLSDGRVVTIHNAIDADYYFTPEARDACRRELGITAEMDIIGYLGRLVPGKGLETLIEAMPTILQAHPQVRLLLVGEGPLRDVLIDLAHDKGVAPLVTFTGFRADVPRLLAALDLFVLPSLAEGLPLSLLEAMAAGKPAVATPVGGVLELIEDEVTGLLVRPSDPAALAMAILRLLEDKGLAERVRCQARFHVVERFRLDRMVQAYDALYRSWLG